MSGPLSAERLARVPSARQPVINRTQGVSTTTTAQVRPAPTPYDEMLAPDGHVRETHRVLHDALSALGKEGLQERSHLRDAYLDRQGITFSLSGRERPLPLDLVPRIITAAEWDQVEHGVAQRLRALEMFLADVYGEGQVLTDGIVPRGLVTSSKHFHRQAHGINPPNGVRLHVSGIDLIRDEVGDFRVLEDNLRCPSGVSYVLENRRTLGHVLPEVFAGHRVRPVDEYPQRLLDAMLAAAPESASDDPTVVVLTPGVHNAAHYEHAFLARRMGVELVEGRDLYCKDSTVLMRTTSGPQRVDVIYRRIDDEYMDPLQFRFDSVLGVPGILNVARAGRVTIANAVGNGVADDKAVYPYVPDLIAYYLGETAILPNVDTYDLQDPDQMVHVLDRLDRMVVKPVDGSGGYGLMIGNQATEQELTAAEARIVADPRGWIAQPVVTFSTYPTDIEGELVPRHVDLRPFAVNDGQKVFVLPGGLTRVALPAGSLVVNSSQGGGSKDTWVLEDDSEPLVERIPEVRRITRVRTTLGARAQAPVPHDERMRQQEGQQQQAALPVGDGGHSC